MSQATHHYPETLYISTTGHFALLDYTHVKLIWAHIHFDAAA